jgi:division protein CdvB (Snf7/Vps24/ESCRT-III family)
LTTHKKKERKPRKKRKGSLFTKESSLYTFTKIFNFLMGNKESNGGGPPPPTTSSSSRKTDSPLEAISVTRDAQGTLEKSIQHLEQRIQKERTLAKQCLSEKTNKVANKQKAQKHLVNAKKLQAQIDKYEAMRGNLDTMQNTLEVAAVTKNIHGALGTASNAMKNMAKELDVEKIETLTDDIQENTAALEEATNLLTQPLGGGDIVLEEEAENDLNELMAEIQEEEAEEEAPAPVKKKAAPKLPDMPVAPTGKVIRKAEVDDEDELAALERAMN